MLREDVKAKIWATDAKGKRVPGEITLKEGWYALSDPSLDKEK